MARHRWTAVPATRSSAPVLKIRLWLVLGSLIVSSVFGLFGGIAWVANKPEPPAPLPPEAAATGVATAVATDFLNGRPTTVAVAEGINPELGGGGSGLPGAVSVAWTDFDLYVQEGRTFEVHHFIVGGTPPRSLAVTVELTGAGPVLAAAPALGPLAISAQPPRRFDWADSEARMNVSDDVKRRVTAWAEAYASDDRQALRDLTGDAERRVYAGLGGLSAEEVDVLGAVPVSGSGDIVVRVSVLLTGEAGFKAEAEYDLRVADQGSADPKVTAWGPAASGGFLGPYANAVTGGPSAAPAADGSTSPEADTGS